MKHLWMDANFEDGGTANVVIPLEELKEQASVWKEEGATLIVGCEYDEDTDIKAEIEYYCWVKEE